MPKPHDWLVIFLIHEDYNLDRQQRERGEKGYVSLDVQRKALFESIRSSSFSENVKIIIIESKVGEKGASKSKSFFIERVQNGFEQYDLKSFEIENGEALRKVVEKIVQKEKAYRKMMVTWGHGSVFGIFLIESVVQKVNAAVSFDQFSDEESKDYDVLPALTRDIDDLDVFKKLHPSELSGVGLRNLYENFDLLTNHELAQVMGHPKFDILIMYNCLMQNVSTQYDLRNAVRYLVAPETGISHPGYNYTAILDFLKTNDGKNVDNVAKTSIETIRKNPLLTTAFQEEMENTWCVRAIDLSDYDIFTASFTELMREWERLGFREVFPSMQNALGDAFNYAKHSLPAIAIRDLKVFLIFLRDDFDIIGKDIFKALRLKIINCIATIDPGNNVLFGKKVFNGKHDTPDANSGFAVLLPTDDGEIDEIRRAFIDIEEFNPAFYKDSGYIKLLKSILLSVSQPIN